MNNYLKLMRIKHYIKNLLVFLPLVFSGKLFNAFLLGKVFIGAFVFSLTASIVYIINDINDRESDRTHHIKKLRPLASRAVKVPHAWLMVIVLVFFVIIITIFKLNDSKAWLLLAIYAAINIAYSAGLKNIPIVDISIIVIGFMLRIAFGGLIVGIYISNWMYLTVMAMSFYLAIGKRRNEIRLNGFISRTVLKHYTEPFLDKMMYVSLGLTLMFYSMWCVTPNELIESEAMIWTVPLVFLICMRYSMNVERESIGDPAEILFGDRVLLLLLFLYMIILMLLFYGGI